MRNKVGSAEMDDFVFGSYLRINSGLFELAHLITSETVNKR